jgi:hypothetical protein
MLPADVLSVICRLHNLRSPFKISFYLVPPIVFLLRATHSFTWEPYAAFHGMARKCHMITAVWTHLRVFLNSKFPNFSCLNVGFCLGGVDGNLHFPVRSMKRLNEAFSILSCWSFFRDSVFYFIVITKLIRYMFLSVLGVQKCLVCFLVKGNDMYAYWVIPPPYSIGTNDQHINLNLYLKVSLNNYIGCVVVCYRCCIPWSSRCRFTHNC